MKNRTSERGRGRGRLGGAKRGRRYLETVKEAENDLFWKRTRQGGTRERKCLKGVRGWLMTP